MEALGYVLSVHLCSHHTSLIKNAKAFIMYVTVNWRYFPTKQNILANNVGRSLSVWIVKAGFGVTSYIIFVLDCATLLTFGAWLLLLLVVVGAVFRSFFNTVISSLLLLLLLLGLCR